VNSASKRDRTRRTHRTRIGESRAEGSGANQCLFDHCRSHTIGWLVIGHSRSCTAVSTSAYSLWPHYASSTLFPQGGCNRTLCVWRLILDLHLSDWLWQPHLYPERCDVRRCPHSPVRAGDSFLGWHGYGQRDGRKRHVDYLGGYGQEQSVLCCYP
jgi:hypothetical protein